MAKNKVGRASNKKQRVSHYSNIEEKNMKSCRRKTKNK